MSYIEGLDASLAESILSFSFSNNQDALTSHGLPPESASQNLSLNRLAERYVKLVLSIGQHDPFYVDAYYGPLAWREQTHWQELAELQAEFEMTSRQFASLPQRLDSPELTQRASFLKKQWRSTGYYLQHLQGRSGDFNTESVALYDAEAPEFSLDSFKQALAEIDALIPGEGALQRRFADYRSGFIVPQERVPRVFETAVEKARALTHRHITMPQDESFEVEYVNDKVWTAYNWYKGNSHSLIQLNQDQPLYIERFLELATHEGYPGHHVFNVLQERELVQGKNWLEYAIYPLLSPISFLSEGSANYGLRLLLSADDILEFERDVLMPMAGLSGDIAHYRKVLALYKKLAYLDNLVCRRLVDGRIQATDAEKLLVEYGLYSESRARQRVQFYLRNRAYVINYNLGEDRVAGWVEADGADKRTQWKRFEALLRRPLTASEFSLK